ncbi:RICIN domain-containing protein [Actinomadura citrea]|uniref:RICIN domain-containing protein n=2 Tax=Actinomadura TaxID=1988 RepID=UPI002E2C5FA7|nr:RICIN domain-containing protein [Actinomadura citrea]
MWECARAGSTFETRYWNNGTVRISSIFGTPTRCMDVPTWAGNGYVVDLRDCNGSPNQEWTIRGNYPYRIVHVASERCLEAQFSTINTDGGRVQVWDCNGAQHQAWNLTLVATPVH